MNHLYLDLPSESEYETCEESNSDISSDETPPQFPSEQDIVKKRGKLKIQCFTNFVEMPEV